MAKLQAKPLTVPDEVREFQSGCVEIFDLGDAVFGRMIFQPGWRWSEQVKHIAGTELCEYHHLGIVMQGRFHVQMADGAEFEIGPDTAFEIPPGHDAWVVGDEAFITIDFAGMRSFGRSAEDLGERVLATILFTDIVDSTMFAERLGDSRWRELLTRYYERTQWELDRFRGRLVTQTGDGVLATFDGSARAVRCAVALRDAAPDVGLRIRVAVHTGEVELVRDNVRGVAVHAASRILGLAQAGEILVSGTTHDLLAGSGLRFEDRGRHELKGLTNERPVYALVG